jgi:hypothetical protein
MVFVVEKVLGQDGDLCSLLSADPAKRQITGFAINGIEVPLKLTQKQYNAIDKALEDWRKNNRNSLPPAQVVLETVRQNLPANMRKSVSFPDHCL